MTPEVGFNHIIDRIECRAMATDGPVTPTLKEATEEELSKLWHLLQKIRKPKKEWFNANQFPSPAPDAPELSVTVLVYDPEFDMHGLGWYNFDTCEWNTLEEFWVDHPFQWSYLPKPEKK